ncbi:hypothetical protein HELRODRAFT_174404 [Helobdella robusta]|uniref:Uncharacterized protein n=1 Tax=Helobdella robusta TaxID=6412 RepID=T1F832_HELRO|nr:hypothetical protein HELRODRAFT_174404 [Helobdella robusta]ESO02929.1 hypothetical protein HELRODRAFT_174404 [Helobdella robusta]
MSRISSEITEKPENIKAWTQNLVHFEESKSTRSYIHKVYNKNVEVLIKKYHSVQKSKQRFEEKWGYIFYITKVNGNWLSNEDKEFYLLQIKTDGQAGYCSSKIIKVHPSKAGKKKIIIAKTDTVEEVKLAILKLGDGKANSIYSEIAEVLDKFQLWSSIKAIISDITSVNTGSKNGVESQLQREFERKNLEPVQFIACQHHVLNTILKHSMNDILDEG